MRLELSPKAVEIVTCARSLLATGGYHSFSYADISESVHISKPSIHHHFPSKAELVQSVVARYREEARMGLASLAGHDPLSQLHAYTGYWAACIRDGTLPFCICAMLAAELPTLPGPVADEVRGHFQDLGSWLASVLAEGASQGAFVLRTTPAAEAMALMATVHGAMLAARAHGDPEIFPTIVQPVVRRLTANSG